MCTANGESESPSAPTHAGQAVDLTFQQQGWWNLFHSAGLNKLDIVFGLHLTGSLDATALRASIQELISRHESLRTILVFDDEGPTHQVAVSGNHNIEVTNVDTAPDNVRETMRKIISEFANRDLDLAKGPLFDARIVTFSNTDHLFVWGINHFIADGHSLNLMSRELWLLYRAFIRGRPSPLAPLPTGFSDYEKWQKRIYRDWYPKHSAYWKARLAGATGIHWPAARQPQCGESRCTILLVPITFSTKASDGLRALAELTRTPLSLVATALYVAVVSRWCNQPDLVVETTFNGRDRLELRNIVGFLAHFLYLRLEHIGEKSVADLLRQVRQEYLRTLSHKDFGGVVIETPELLSGTYFQWLSWAPDGISGIPTHSESAEVGLKGEVIPVEQPDIPGDNSSVRVSATLWNSSEGIRGKIYYRSDLFSRGDVERFLLGLEATAAGFVESSLHSRVKDLTVIAEHSAS
jgi:hypothetical protein